MLRGQFGNGGVDESLEGKWENCASMILYGEGNELGRVEMKAARLNTRNDEVPGMRALIHVTEMQKT